MAKKSNIIVDELSAEEEIAQLQLERLRLSSRERLLSYEEVKIYDLLTKNLLESKKQKVKDKVVNPEKPLVLNTIELKELLRIAQEVKPQDLKATLNVVDDDS